ncbi:NACHT domain-containing protein [Streptomyces sp. NPDC088817]|uniref:NACHT domain-containing protein n=1 Tax=Streptomyces sp. NPDC088817 TaxID=3365907 RepID=UPI003819FC5D
MAERYDYESLGADVFQQLCQAVLVAANPDVQCFPVGMPDGGRDASAPHGNISDAIIYQVKFRQPTPNRLATPDEILKWITKALKGEVKKVQHLASRGAEKYVLMTNAQCSSHPDNGTRDLVQTWLDSEMPIPSQVWWRDDLDRRLDGQTEVKRTYGFIRDLTGLAELLGLREPEVKDRSFVRIAQRDPRVSALMKYMMHQYNRDRVVKFKQAELEPQLLDVFIDVPLARNLPERPFFASNTLASRRYEPRQSPTVQKWSGLISLGVSSAFRTSNRTTGLPAASVLLSESMVNKEAPSTSRVVVEGAPGQGKSTVGQYVCQVHRSRLLGNSDIERFSLEHRSSPVRLPFHVDFRDLAAWLRRLDPFDVTNDGPPAGWSDTLESFLAAQVTRASGGINFTVSDLDAVLRATPAILVLDGLDEVPDLNDRRSVVGCVNEALNRIEPFSPSFRTVATSRPSSFSKTPGFSKREYTYFTLGDLPLSLVLEYTDGWLESRKVSHQAAHEIRQVLGQKLGQPHIVDLARNPMQLAILLWLVRKKGPSLPDKRTALYREYMETFLDREAEKSEIVRDERELILDLHGYVAWVLHCLAETGDSNGSISEPRLKSLLKKYLVLRGYKKKKLELVDNLFTGMTDRVMVLTSRVQNTFEFEVQPLREYFAARYLYSTARTSSPGSERTGNRSDRFEALLRNPYWWNVTRFYAGFSDVGELANLVDLLEDLVNSGGDFSLLSYSREVALTLLRDQVFSQKPRSVSKVVELISTEDSVALLSGKGISHSELSLPADSGGEEIIEIMMKRIEAQAASGIPDFDAARFLASNATGRETVDWWYRKWSSARGIRARRLWFALGRYMNTFDVISASHASQVVAVMGGDLHFWHMALQLDSPQQPFAGEASVDSFLVALRAGVRLTSDLGPGQQSGGVQAGISNLSSINHVLFLLYNNGHPNPWGGVDERALADGMVPARYVDLFTAMRNTLVPIDGATGVRNDYGIWVDYHEALAEVLGGECRRTLALAAALGDVRSGNVSRKKVDSLVSGDVSPVLRSRYARQRRTDLEWWAEQAKGIQNADDAFFVLCCLMAWAPATALAANARTLEKWVRGFDAYTLSIIRSLTSPGWARNDRESQHELPERITPGLLYLASAKMPRRESIAKLGSTGDSSRDRDLIGLAGTARLGALVFSRDWVDSIDNIVDAYASYQRDGYIYPAPYRTTVISSQTSREVLRRVTELPVCVRFSANESLMAELARKAATLSDTSAKEEWFDREMLD